MNEVTKVNFLILCFIVFFTLTCYAQEPFAIKHEKFKPDYEGTCNTDVKVASVEGDGLYVLGKISIRDGYHTLWCYGAKHIWIGKLSYAGYIFDSDKKYPLQFTVSKDKGYLFLKGKGTVTTPKGKIVKLKSAGIDREKPYGIDIANINRAPKGEIPVKILAGAELERLPTGDFGIKSGEVETEKDPIHVGRLKKTDVESNVTTEKKETNNGTTGKISGILMDYDSGKPISGHQIFIFAVKGPADKEGWVKVDDLKIEATTSENGAFTFSNIPPGEYLFTVKYRTRSQIGSLPSFKFASLRNKDGETIRITLKKGQILDLKEVWVQLR
jgi:hypothetical protein